MICFFCRERILSSSYYGIIEVFYLSHTQLTFIEIERYNKNTSYNTTTTTLHYKCHSWLCFAYTTGTAGAAAGAAFFAW